MKIEKSPNIIKCYSFDATGITFEPEGVVFAETEKDIIEVVEYCIKNKKSIIPRGAGSGFTAGCVPVRGGIVLSLEKMDKILDIDTKNMVAVAEPGVITANLQRSVESFNLYYPPDPSSLEFSTIGGNVAENAGGPKAIKYGVTANYVMGIRAVIGTAEVIDTTRKVRKNVVGYNITPLFVGSEGTLGVISKVLLRLIPLPEERMTILSFFKDIYQAGQTVVDIMNSGIVPSAIEIMDIASIECVKRYKSIDIPKSVEGVLIIELDGRKQEVKKEASLVKKICRNNKAFVKVAKDEKEREDIWQIRRAISPSLFHIAPTKINEDVCVPVSEIPRALKRFLEIGKKYGVPVVCFGHAGDGNIHVNVMTDEKNSTLMEKAKLAVREIFITTVELEGVLSGEHGIGYTKSKFLPIQTKKADLHLWRRVKKAFDPENIFNPGKMGLI